jgi:hypothetical protein
MWGCSFNIKKLYEKQCEKITLFKTLRLQIPLGFVAVYYLGLTASDLLLTLADG